MKQIQKEDLSNLKFNGIIVGVPIMEKIKEGQHDDISFIVECNYYSNGKHGYPEPGYGADNSSFYHVCYNTDVLKNGLWMNATSRFTIDYIFRFDSYNYYKFDSMTEFCTWYCQRQHRDVYIQSGDLAGKIKQITPEPRMEKISLDVEPDQPLMWDGKQYVSVPKLTRREQLKDVSKLFLYQTALNELEDKLDNTEGYWEQQELKEELQKLKTQFENWMDEEVDDKVGI